MPNTKRGFGVVGIIIIILLALGGGAYLWSQKKVEAPSSTDVPTDNSFTTLSQPDETASWKTYKNDKYGFEFKYPSNYKIRDDYNNDWNFLEKHPPYKSSLLSLGEFGLEKFFTVDVSPFYRPVYNLEDLYKQEAFRLNVLSKTEINLGVEKGFRVEIDLSESSPEVKYLFYHNGVGFVISYQEPYNHHIFSTVMSNFRFTE